jgi:hypothetical protein
MTWGLVPAWSKAFATEITEDTEFIIVRKEREQRECFTHRHA